jgi:hypothetical protein
VTTETQQITVEDASALTGLAYDWEVRSAPDAAPAVGPAWLQATNGIDPRTPPCQYLLTRPSQDQLAALPMHVALTPGTPDADPRSYFGGTTGTPDQQVCCGSRETSPAAGILAGLKNSDVFPALVLGSLPGYRTELLHTYWTPDLAANFLDAAIAYARSHNIATVVAPWVPDKGSGKALARELRHRGAVASFWAVEDYLPMRQESLQAHLTAGRSRDRYRYQQDMKSAASIGLDVRPLTTAELRSNLSWIGTMAAANRRRYGYDITETHIPTVLTRLAELGVPHRAKALRGCKPRDVTSYLLTDQQQVREAFTAAAAVNTPHRRAEYASP